MRHISQITTQKLSYCRQDDATLYASLELSQATWLVTSLSPGSERMSKYSTLGGDSAALLGLLRRLQARAERLAGGPVDIVVIHAARGPDRPSASFLRRRLRWDPGESCPYTGDRGL